MRKHYSLKKRLLIYTCVINGLLASALMLAAYRAALEEVNEILDAQMVYLAKRVLINIQPQSSQFDPLRRYHEEDLFIDVWAYADQRDKNHEQHMLLPRQSRTGFYPHQNSNGEWVTYVIPTAKYQIQISQQHKVRRLFALELASSMILPYLVVFPLLLLASAWLVRHNLQPLEDFKNELVQRSSSDLTTIESQRYPLELLPTIDEMNHLFERISTAQQEQKQFIADAAHELRTPITVLNLQTKILLNQAPEDQNLKNLAQGLNRTQHLVNQLLALAQQDAGLSQGMPLTRLCLNEIAVDCIEQLMDLAMQKNIDVGIVRNETVYMHSVAQSLHSIIFNLLDNAIKYTPENGVINLSIARYDTAGEIQIDKDAQTHQDLQILDQRTLSADGHRAQQVIILLEDSGPGLEQDQYTQVLKRFYRVEHHLTIGSGLGLAIVDQAIQQLGGQFTLSRSEELGGLKASIRLPIR